MKCPKCGFNSFEFHDTCRKCGKDLSAFKVTYGIRPLVPPVLKTAPGDPLAHPAADSLSQTGAAAALAGAVAAAPPAEGGGAPAHTAGMPLDERVVEPAAATPPPSLPTFVEATAPPNLDAALALSRDDFAFTSPPEPVSSGTAPVEPPQAAEVATAVGDLPFEAAAVEPPTADTTAPAQPSKVGAPAVGSSDFSFEPAVPERLTSQETAPAEPPEEDSSAVALAGFSPESTSPEPVLPQVAAPGEAPEEDPRREEPPKGEYSLDDFIHFSELNGKKVAGDRAFGKGDFDLEDFLAPAEGTAKEEACTSQGELPHKEPERPSAAKPLDWLE